MAVVFVIAVLQPLLHSIVGLIQTEGEGEWAGGGDTHLYAWLIERSILVSIPVLFIMWRSRSGWSFFGLGVPPRIVDAAIGLAVLILDYMLYYVLWYMFWFATAGMDHTYSLASASHAPLLPVAQGDAAVWSMPPWWLALAVIAAAANGFAEELVMRAYFIPRLEQTLRSTFKAVLLTSVVFGAYHLYQGVWPALFVVISGVMLGFVYVQTRRLWPVFFAHMFMDLVPFLFRASSGTA